ncbi:MAG TPA: peptidase M4 [Bacillales bacterium]|nr:peptidase M4 [Bacillales bacterium]
MNWKKSLLAAGIGIIGGFVLREGLEKGTITPEKALKSVKKTVGQKFAIDGSWVHMRPEHLIRNGLDFSAYRGGVTVSDDKQVKHYNFIVDAKTGTVLDFTEDEV